MFCFFIVIVETKKSRKWLKRDPTNSWHVLCFLEAGYHFSGSAFACVLFFQRFEQSAFFVVAGQAHTRAGELQLLRSCKRSQSVVR